MLYIAKLFYRSHKTDEHGQFDLIIKAEMVESAMLRLKVGGKRCIAGANVIPHGSDIFFDSIIQINDSFNDDVVFTGFASYSERNSQTRCAVPNKCVTGIDAFSYPGHMEQKPMFIV